MTGALIFSILFAVAILSLPYLLPEQETASVPQKYKPATTPKQKKANTDDQEWETSSGETFRYTDKVPDRFKGGATVESDIVHNAGLTDRINYLTIDEERAINDQYFNGKERKLLTIIKARKLKKYWARGESAATASEKINTEGYGLRVCEQHYALFNHFHKALSR